MRDLFHSITPVLALAPGAGPSDNTAQVCAIIDHDGYESVTYIISTGTLVDADATFTALLEDGDAADLADHAAVVDSQLLGTEALASFTFAADSKVFKLGYIGNKRKTRLTITPAGNASAAPLSVVAIKGHPHLEPTLNPPA